MTIILSSIFSFIIVIPIIIQNNIDKSFLKKGTSTIPCINKVEKDNDKIIEVFFCILYLLLFFQLNFLTKKNLFYLYNLYNFF